MSKTAFLDFNEIGVKIHESQIDNIPEILNSLTDSEIKNLKLNGEKIYKEYFDYENCAKKIINKINKIWKVK